MPDLKILTRDWGPTEDVALYLERCQHDTPPDVVSRVWKLVRRRRPRRIPLVTDFGAGDCRFAIEGDFGRYVGYEIDPARAIGPFPRGVESIKACAFSSDLRNADLCVGNPPFVRNQSLPSGWKRRAAAVIKERTGVAVSGLANAWQYFTFLALASTKASGLVALVIPYEWVSRPSSRALRDYIRRNGWTVDVYRLRDETFGHVLTTSSITIIDKRSRRGEWRYFEDGRDGRTVEVPSPAGASRSALEYARKTRTADVFAKRGLSPGTQKLLVLTEVERRRWRLKIGTDVVRCVTSLRPVSERAVSLTKQRFNRRFRDAGLRCWLIRPVSPLSQALRNYLRSTSKADRNTSTCNGRKQWWRFTLPDIPPVLVATGFVGARPKAVVNEIGAVAVGSVSGVHGLSSQQSHPWVRRMKSTRVRGRIVSHANGLRKLEVGQLTTLLQQHRLAA